MQTIYNFLTFIRNEICAFLVDTAQKISDEIEKTAIYKFLNFIRDEIGEFLDKTAQEISDEIEEMAINIRYFFIFIYTSIVVFGYAMYSLPSHLFTYVYNFRLTRNQANTEINANISGIMRLWLLFMSPIKKYCRIIQDSLDIGIKQNKYGQWGKHHLLRYLVIFLKSIEYSKIFSKAAKDWRDVNYFYIKTLMIRTIKIMLEVYFVLALQNKALYLIFYTIPLGFLVDYTLMIFVFAGWTGYIEYLLELIFIDQNTQLDTKRLSDVFSAIVNRYILKKFIKDLLLHVCISLVYLCYLYTGIVPMYCAYMLYGIGLSYITNVMLKPLVGNLFRMLSHVYEYVFEPNKLEINTIKTYAVHAACALKMIFEYCSCSQYEENKTPPPSLSIPTDAIPSSLRWVDAYLKPS